MSLLLTMASNHNCRMHHPVTARSMLRSSVFCIATTVVCLWYNNHATTLSTTSVASAFQQLQVAVLQHSKRGDTITSNSQQHRFKQVTKTAGTTLDDDNYEYIPLNDDDDDEVTAGRTLRKQLQLNKKKQSSNTIFVEPPPISIRGEAIRSGLQSKYGICFKTKQRRIVIKVSGIGTMQFCSTKFPNTIRAASYTSTCLLNRRGYVVDTIDVVAVSEKEVYLIPSSSDYDLYELLSATIFPMDQVTLTQYTVQEAYVLASSVREDDDRDTTSTRELIQSRWEDYINEYYISTTNTNRRIQLPTTKNTCTIHDFTTNNHHHQLLILPTTGLPTPVTTSFGYSVYEICNITNQQSSSAAFDYLTSEQCAHGPIPIQTHQDYTALRIECGVPAYGTEFTALIDDDDTKEKKKRTPAGPIELHLRLEDEKGCYLGQEGVSAMARNKRGPPRSLYCITFDNTMNSYDTSPCISDDLYVLGSNEQIYVGHITSIAESTATGEDATVGLCFVRRPDTILRSMVKRDLELPKHTSSNRRVETDDTVLSGGSNDDDNDGMILPPPLDPLHNLEVIIGGTYTIGSIQSIPARRSGSMYTSTVFETDDDDESDTPKNDTDDIVSSSPVADTNDTDDDDSAEAEIKRKEEKMILLQERAAAAMARRQKQKQAASSKKTDDDDEVQRKQEKMALLKARADAAMERRRRQKQQND